MKVSWDDAISQYDGENKIHVPNHQPASPVTSWFINHNKTPMNTMVISTINHRIQVILGGPILSRGWMA